VQVLFAIRQRDERTLMMSKSDYNPPILDQDHKKPWHFSDRMPATFRGCQVGAAIPPSRYAGKNRRQRHRDTNAMLRCAQISVGNRSFAV